MRDFFHKKKSQRPKQPTSGIFQDLMRLARARHPYNSHGLGPAFPSKDDPIARSSHSFSQSTW
jgi:hypothetical protein